MEYHYCNKEYHYRNKWYQTYFFFRPTSSSPHFPTLSYLLCTEAVPSLQSWRLPLASSIHSIV